MKKIGGVSLWIWGIGFLVMLGGLASLRPMFASGISNDSRMISSNEIKLTDLEKTEQAARKYFDSIKNVRQAVKNGLGDTEIPDGLPMGDRMEYEKKIALKVSAMNKIHAARRQAEDELEQAESVRDGGYLKALRNCWEATLERSATWETEYNDMSEMTFEEAVEFGRRVSKLPGD